VQHLYAVADKVLPTREHDEAIVFRPQIYPDKHFAWREWCSWVQLWCCIPKDELELQLTGWGRFQTHWAGATSQDDRHKDRAANNRR
jgi:hypothetical protein